MTTVTLPSGIEPAAPAPCSALPPEPTTLLPPEGFPADAPPALLGPVPPLPQPAFELSSPPEAASSGSPASEPSQAHTHAANDRRRKADDLVMATIYSDRSIVFPENGFAMSRPCRSPDEGAAPSRSVATFQSRTESRYCAVTTHMNPRNLGLAYTFVVFLGIAGFASAETKATKPKSVGSPLVTANSAARPLPPTPPAPNASEKPVVVVESRHRIRRLVADGEDLFWIHENDLDGARADGLGLSRASVNGGESRVLFEGSADSPHPGSVFAATPQGLFVASDSYNYSPDSWIWKLPRAGGVKVELAKVAMTTLDANEQTVVWVGNGFDQVKQEPVPVRIHSLPTAGGASKVLVELPREYRAVADLALDRDHAYLALAGSSAPALVRVSLKGGKLQPIASKVDASKLRIGQSRVFVMLTGVGQVVSYPTGGGAGETLIGPAGTCSRARASGFDVTKTHLIWTDGTTLNRCPLKGGAKNEVLVNGLTGGADQLQVSADRVFWLSTKVGVEPRTLINRFDLKAR